MIEHRSEQPDQDTEFREVTKELVAVQEGDWNQTLLPDTQILLRETFFSDRRDFPVIALEHCDFARKLLNALAISGDLRGILRKEERKKGKNSSATNGKSGLSQRKRLIG